MDKFKPQKTTDDCYTPDYIYNAVAAWVTKEYSVSADSFVRPFFPGGDYEHHPYPDGCIVVDNPPFSIISEIVRFYCDHHIHFFLFAPTMTLFSVATNRCKEFSYIIANCDIVYENGALVNTSFVTNLDEYQFRVIPELQQSVMITQNSGKETKRKNPKYEYPPNVVNAGKLTKLCEWGVAFDASKDETYFIRQLDAQKAAGVGLFGSGFLLSNNLATKKREAELLAERNKISFQEDYYKALDGAKGVQVDGTSIKWQLSDREQAIVDSLGGDSHE